MSLMRIRGSKYHCTQCKKVIVVEYEGGLQRTLVSHPVIDSQATLRRQLRLRSQTSAEYMHQMGFCEACVAGAKPGDGGAATPQEVTDFNEAISKLLRMADRHEKRVRTHATSCRERFSAALTLETFRELAPQEYEATLGKWDTTPPFEREFLVRNFLDSAKFDLAPRVAGALSADPKLRSTVRSYAQKAPDLVAKAREALAACGSYRYAPVSLRQAENLNPYLASEYSIRRPVRETPNTNFYFKDPLDRERAGKAIADAEALTHLNLETRGSGPGLMLRLFELVHFPS